MLRAARVVMLTAALAGGSGAHYEEAQAQPGVIPKEARPADQLRCTAPDEPLNFPSYWVGPGFDGLELTGVLRSCHSPPGPARGVNSVDYLYGECDASRGGCGLPISVQTWPSSVRHKALYSLEPETEVADVGGVPAEIWDGGGQIEIFMSDVTVVVFGDDPDRVDRAVEALVRGPDVLAEVAAYGLVFDSGCVSDRGYCQADPVQKSGVLGSLLIGVALFLVGPILAFVFRPPAVPASGRISAADRGG